MKARTDAYHQSEKAAIAAVPIRFAEVQLPALRTAAMPATNELEVRLPDGRVLRGGRVADLVPLVRALRF